VKSWLRKIFSPEQSPKASSPSPPPSSAKSDPADYTSLLAASSFPLKDGSQARLQTQSIGPIVLPTGRIVACDPLVCPETLPFERAATPGAYPLFIVIAHIRTDQRIALAVIHFSQQPAVTWQPATLPNHARGYGVDSGNGCFMDARAAEQLLINESTSAKIYDAAAEQMTRNYLHTRSWANVIADGQSGANVILFSSGYGDGFFESYFGFDNAGNLATLLTDFKVLPVKWNAEVKRMW